MFKNNDWFFIALCLAGLYMFFSFDDWMNKEFVDGAIGSKRTAGRAFLFFLAKNKYGYWIVRCIFLLPAVIWIKGVVDKLRKEKTK